MSAENIARRRTLPEEDLNKFPSFATEALQKAHLIDLEGTTTTTTTTTTGSHTPKVNSRYSEAAKQLLCGGVAGSVAKTVTAPFSRLTILFQVHSLVTTKGHRPKFATSLKGGVDKIIERGGIRSMWKGNMTSVLHRFPYSAINFFVYENTLDFLSSERRQRLEQDSSYEEPEHNLTQSQLIRRMSKIVLADDHDDEAYDEYMEKQHKHRDSNNINIKADTGTLPLHKFLAGASAGTAACVACYPLDLVRARLTTELEGQEHYRGIVDAFRKIFRNEGFRGFYSGIGATLFVAVPSFAISYTVYGTLKEYMVDDELFYNLRKIDDESGEPKLSFILTILCGAASGTLATLVTFPMDTIRRRMQIQNLHVPESQRLSSRQQFTELVTKEGLGSLYRGLTPELLKVISMVGTMFFVYETTKDLLDV